MLPFGVPFGLAMRAGWMRKVSTRSWAVLLVDCTQSCFAFLRICNWLDPSSHTKDESCTPCRFVSLVYGLMTGCASCISRSPAAPKGSVSFPCGQVYYGIIFIGIIRMVSVVSLWSSSECRAYTVLSWVARNLAVWTLHFFPVCDCAIQCSMWFTTGSTYIVHKLAVSSNVSGIHFLTLQTPVWLCSEFCNLNLLTFDIYPVSGDLVCCLQQTQCDDHMASLLATWLTTGWLDLFHHDDVTAVEVGSLLDILDWLKTTLKGGGEKSEQYWEVLQPEARGAFS